MDTVNFNNFWPWMVEEAKNQGLKKGEWLKLSNVGPQRYAELDRAGSLQPADGMKSRPISATYFIKLLGGLNVSLEKIEERSGIKFTDEQRKELQYNSWCKAHRDLIMKLMEDPKKLELAKKIAELG